MTHLDQTMQLRLLPHPGHQHQYRHRGELQCQSSQFQSMKNGKKGHVRMKRQDLTQSSQSQQW